MRVVMDRLFFSMLLLALPGLQPNVAARGASNGRVRVENDGRRLSVTAQNLSVGRYAVLLGVRCPVPDAPAEVRTGRIPTEDRTGKDPDPLSFEHRKVGELEVTDKTKAMTMSVDEFSEEGLDFVMLREMAPASPSLSDRHGLVACGPLPRDSSTGPDR